MGGEELLGSAPDGWEYTTLRAACERGGGDIQTGPFGSQLHAADYVPIGIPSIMPQNIGDNRIVEAGIARISPQDANRLTRYLVRSGDIVYSRRGDVERRALVRDHEDGWLCGTGCLRVRLGDRGPDPRFVTYYLGHPSVREWIVRHAHGATMPNLNTSILGACPLVVPPIDEQRAIASILGALDDKIELNRRMNETLEAIAHALFKSWFVDFDPVRAKAAGRMPTAMNSEMATLFPSHFEKSALGEIPAGWRVDDIYRSARVVYGAPFASELFNRDRRGRPLIRIRDLADHEPQVWTTEEHPRGSLIEPGDIVVGMDGEFRAHVWQGPESWLNQRLCKFEPIAAFGRAFVYFAVMAPLAEVERSEVGTTVIHLGKSDIDRFRVAYATEEVHRAFSFYAEPLIERRFRNGVESRTLATLRDALLPKLLSGEIRVRDAERVVEKVT